MNTLFRIIYGFITTLFVLVAFVMVASVIPLPWKTSMKVVLSGSMEPTISTGSVVFIKPNSAYTIGDVITFMNRGDTNASIPTTHRIVSVRAVEGSYIFTTKGDANNTPDVTEVPQDRVIGTVFFSIPLLGYLVSFAKTTLGFLLLVVVPAVLVILEEMKTIVREIKERMVRRDGGAPPSTPTPIS